MVLNQYQDAVARHVVEHIGSIHGLIQRPKRDESSVDLALLHVPATDSKPFQVLVTAGMAEQPMKVPTDLEETPPERVELMFGLPAEWPIEGAGPEHQWPLHLLSDLATFPHEFGGWLGEGHTIPNGDPMEPYSPGLQFACALIAPSLILPPEAQLVPLPADRVAHLLGVVPLFEREVELKVKEGATSLYERLDRHRVTEVFDPSRRAVAGALLDLMDETKS